MRRGRDRGDRQLCKVHVVVAQVADDRRGTCIARVETNDDEAYMQTEAVSPPGLLTRRTQPTTPARSTSRIRALLGLQSPVDNRSDLHDTMFVVPRPPPLDTPAAPGCEVRSQWESARMMAPTPDPGCSGTMGRGLLPRLLEMITTPSKNRKGKSRVILEVDGELLPLDGEEGELIDDEGCFLEAGESDGTGQCVCVTTPAPTDRCSIIPTPQIYYADSLLSLRYTFCSNST